MKLFSNLLNQKSNSKKSILNEKKCYGDYNTFHNENLCKMINSLNNFSLQGSQTCSYYCMASMILIVKNEYNIQDIIDLTHKGIFDPQSCPFHKM